MNYKRKRIVLYILGAILTTFMLCLGGCFFTIFKMEVLNIGNQADMNCGHDFGALSAESIFDELPYIQKVVAAIGARGYAATDAENRINMENPSLVTDFCAQVEKNQDAAVSIFRVYDKEGLIRLDFKAKNVKARNENGQNEKLSVVMTTLSWNEKRQVRIQSVEQHQLSSIKMTNNGYLIYTLKNVTDWARNEQTAILVRTIPQENRWLCEKYIRPIGYQGNNLFLTDWAESNIADMDQVINKAEAVGTHQDRLDFNDLYEYVYPLVYDRRFDCQNYAYDPQKNVYHIPEGEFEQVVLRFFAITADQLKRVSSYDEKTHIYEWQELSCENYIPKRLPVPEVVAYRQQDDHTVILTVNAVDTEEGSRCVFTHEVTVRIDTDGGFQYMSNHILPAEQNVFPFYQHRQP